MIPLLSSRRTPASKPLIGISELSTIIQANYLHTQAKGKGKPRESVDLEGSHDTPASTNYSLPHTDEEIYASARMKLRSRTISNASSEDKNTQAGVSTLRAASLPAESRHANPMQATTHDTRLDDIKCITYWLDNPRNRDEDLFSILKFTFNDNDLAAAFPHRIVEAPANRKGLAVRHKLHPEYAAHLIMVMEMSTNMLNQ